MSEKIQGVPVEVKFGTRTDILYVHPDGVIVGNSSQLALQFERTQRAAKRVEQLRRRLSGGCLSREDWEEAQGKLDEQMREGMEKLQAQLDGGEIQQKDYDDSKRTNDAIYKKEVESLLNQRDGDQISLEESDRLEAELEEWLKRASVKPFAAPMLKSVVLDWTLKQADENGRPTGEPLPVSFDSINSLPEDFVILAFTKVMNHYKEDEEKEKKPTGKPADSSPTPKPGRDTSLMISGSTESAEPTALTPTSLNRHGASESLSAP